MSDRKWELESDGYGYTLKKYNYAVFSDDHTVLPTFNSNELDEFAEEITKDTVYEILKKKNLLEIEHRYNDIVMGKKMKITKDDIDVTVDLDYGNCGVNTSSIEIEINLENDYEDEDYSFSQKLCTIVANELNEIEENETVDDIWYRIYDEALSYSYYVPDMSDVDFKRLYETDKILYVESEYSFKFEKDCDAEQRAEGYVKMGCDPSSLKVIDFVEGKKVNEVSNA